MNYKLKRIPSHELVSTKKGWLPVLVRFLKERGCWNFLRERLIHSGRYKNDPKYGEMYRCYEYNDGIEDFIRRVRRIGLQGILSTRIVSCFEYDDIGFSDEFDGDWKKVVALKQLKIENIGKDFKNVK